jgi:hypothetical protein
MYKGRVVRSAVIMSMESKKSGEEAKKKKQRKGYQKKSDLL